ncbi:MAG: hypothetical protein ACI4GW_05120 [Lachnospiraceae bacterium]
MQFIVITIGSILVMCFSGMGFILTMAYFFGHCTYLYGFENSRETTAIIKEFYRDYSVSYESSSEPILEYYNEFTQKKVRKQLMNTKVSSSNAYVGDRIRIQYTDKKVRIIEPKYITENTYKKQKYIIPPLICAIAFFVSFCFLILSILLEHLNIFQYLH